MAVNTLARMAFVFFFVSMSLFGSAAVARNATPAMWLVAVGLLIATQASYVAIHLTRRGAR